MSVRPVPDGDDPAFDGNTFAKVFEPIEGREWDALDEEKIKKVLAGYCIEPEEVVHNKE